MRRSLQLALLGAGSAICLLAFHGQSAFWFGSAIGRALFVSMPVFLGTFILVLLRSPQAVSAGYTLVAIVWTAGFFLWYSDAPDPNGMGGLIWLLSVPGIFVGAIFARAVEYFLPDDRSVRVFGRAVALATAGLMMNSAYILQSL